MALLRRELCRQIKGPEVTHADCCTLVFDTDAKTLYVEREVAHLDVGDGTADIQTTTMDICDYLKQGGQTAGHRELWRLLRTLFGDDLERSDDIEAASGRPFALLAAAVARC
jgi:hypothetical protein